MRPVGAWLSLESQCVNTHKHPMGAQLVTGIAGFRTMEPGSRLFPSRFSVVPIYSEQ